MGGNGFSGTVLKIALYCMAIVITVIPRVAPKPSGHMREA